MLREEAGSTTASADDILVTNGSGQALDLICSLFCRRGDTIVVEDPTYFLALFTFRDYDLNVVPVRSDERGFDVDELESKLRAGLRPSLVYAVPLCGNPTGATMPPERMRKLVELSRQYSFKIASDEVYVQLSFSERAPPSLMTFDDPAQPTVFAMNSFSKILGPGVRLGWLETHPSHIKRIVSGGLLLSGGGLNPFASCIVAELLRSGFQQEYAARLRLHYAACCNAMCDAVDRYLPRDVDFCYYRPQGGFFLWLVLPERFDAARLLQRAESMKPDAEGDSGGGGVSFFPGQRFSAVDGAHPHALRLCFAWLEQERIVEGVRRLAGAIADFDQSSSSSSSS